MSAAAAPWSVKGIDPKAREIAKDLARRSGMTLGEWLNSMIMEDDGDDDGYTPLPRRPHAMDAIERRSRSRRLDDAYAASDEGFQRLAASIDAISSRLEASERRSTIAIQGVDQAVAGLVRRLEAQEGDARAWGRRIDDISEELKEGHRRLRRFEQETGPKTIETFGKVESSLGALASRLYDIEERQRTAVNELRQRMDAAEKVAGPGAGSELMGQVGARLDAAQAATTEALRSLERSFGDLDRRLAQAEARGAAAGSPEAARFEKLAEALSRQVENNRVEMLRRLETAEADGRMDRIERAVLAIGEQVKSSEQRSAQAVEAMGREVLRIAQNLNGRMKRAETAATEQTARLGQELSARVERDLGRYAQGVEQRLTAADDRHALALERLGGEITRISDRLSERIAQSERRSAQALEDISRRLSDSADKIEQRYDRASGELVERMRLSEERTAKLLAEARESIEQRVAAAPREAPLEAPRRAAEPDWRAAAFPDETFAADPWPGDPDPAAAPSPFPAAAPPPTAAEAEAEPAFVPPPPAQDRAPFGSPAAFGGFGGADVSDALEATADEPDPAPAAPQPAAPAAFAPAPLSADEDFAAETEFVDPRALRAAAQAGRAASTRDTIEAARAAMATAEPEPPARQGFGLLKRGGKSKLQERIDRQAAREGSTIRKTLLASATAVALTGGGMYGYARLTEAGVAPLRLGGASAEAAPAAGPLAAVALGPIEATPAESSEAADLYAQASAQLDAGEPAGLEALKRAANLGYAPAQLHLAGLYHEGGQGLEVDDAESRTWARRAAESGDPKGMHAYGMYLFDGVGGPRNTAEALDWLKRAAEQGLIDSQYNVARLYETGGEGIAADRGEALKWYMLAARAGDGEAQSAVERLSPQLTAEARQAAQRAVDAFQAAPLA